MLKLFHRAAKRVAVSPGTLNYLGEKKVEAVRVRFLDYDQERFTEQQVSAVEECFPLRETPSVSWINLDGLHDTELLGRLATRFELHPLVVEDIINTHQRPKLEDHQDYIFIVLKMLHFDEEDTRISAEQFSLVLGSNYVLSFQERYGDVFDPVRERIRQGKGRSRKMGPDYLAYMLIDAVIDNYFVILEKIGEQIEAMEQELMDEPTPESLQTIHELKREMILLRRSVWPLREVLGTLERGESKLIKKATSIFLRDVYDHTIQVIDAVESYRDVLSGLQDLYLSSISNKMNEVMKVLTIIATVFIPLSFLAGIFGMNFEFMPELKWKWSYLFFWIVIIVVAGGMVTYFRRKRWL